MNESPTLSATASSAGKPRMVISLCTATIKWTLLALTFLIPLFFLPWTTEVTELNKQLLLFVGTVIAGLAWLGKMLAERRFEYRRTIVNAIVLMFVLIYGISTWSSVSSYLSVIGDFGQEQAGFFTVLCFALLYFVAVNNITTEPMLKKMMGAMMLSGFFAAVFGLLQGLGVYLLPFEFTQTPSFNTVGTAASLGVFLVFIVILASGILLFGHGSDLPASKKELAVKVMVAVTAILSLFIIAALDFWPVTLTMLISSALIIAYSFIHARSMKGLGGILLPVAGLIISLMLLFFRFPVALGYPAEVMPSMKASVSIAGQTLREHAFLGSGPGTFIYDYAKHRSSDVNQTAFWNIRFDRASSSFFTLLATIGLLGTLSWLMVSLFLLGSAAKKLLRSDEHTWHILIGMFSAWFVLVFAKFVYSSTFSLDFMFWIMMAMLVVVHKHDFYSVRFERSPRAAMVVSFVFIIGVVFSLSGLFVEGQRYMAEVAYAKAISLDKAGNVDQVITELTNAVNFNQKNDVYLRNLALALLAKADKLISEPLGLTQEENESQDDFAGRQRAEAEKRVREASSLTAEAVNIAKRATEINPSNVANWTVLASVYRSLTGVTEGADEWALQSYQSAIEREPNNPSLHTNLGDIYLLQSSNAAKGLETEDEEAKATAQAKVDELLGKAIDSLNKAVELKADYGPAHFSLALALDQQGKLGEAITKMETVVQLNPKDVGVGFQLALLYYRNEQKEDAIKLLESVIQLSPNYSNARWYLAAMYDEAGNKDAAIAQLEKVLEANPQNELVTRKLNELKGTVVPEETAEGTVPVDGELPPPIEVPIQDENQPAVGQ
ncbi:MAG: tetratricopeptide repeat protein [Patescibacteria group bacterium]